MVSEAFTASVQAVALAALDPKQPGRSLLAVGLGDGSLQIFHFVTSLDESTVQVKGWKSLWKATAYQEHCGAILSLAWQRPLENERLLLASAGEDHAAHIYEVSV